MLSDEGKTIEEITDKLLNKVDHSKKSISSDESSRVESEDYKLQPTEDYTLEGLDFAKTKGEILKIKARILKVLVQENQRIKTYFDEVFR